MPEWITGNIGNIIIALIVAAVISAAVISMIRKRKRGCGCGCEGCAVKNNCHKKHRKQ